MSTVLSIEMDPFTVTTEKLLKRNCNDLIIAIYMLRGKWEQAGIAF